MIQFNLLPDVKKQYVKAKRTKRLIYSSSLLVSAAVVGVTVVMFTFVHVAQKKNVSDLTKDIEARASDIQSTPDLNTILTVQNQLSLLPDLHEAKPSTSRIFDYISYITPQEVSITSLDVDFETSVINVAGTADKIATVNKYVENIKAVRVAPAGAGVDEERNPYTNVETELSGDNEGASFDITFTFDPAIFDNNEQLLPRLGQDVFEPATGEGEER